MPDDLPALITLLNNDSETLAVAALNKIDKPIRPRRDSCEALKDGGESAQVYKPRCEQEANDSVAESAARAETAIRSRARP